jgi:DNA-directed RNA polymerase subunit RPC12/RpoP
MGVLFACGACGSPSVELPRAFTDSAGVHCRRCGHQLGTWGAFKQQTKELILTELAARGQKPEGVRSSDPLPGLNSGPARVA